MSGDDPCPLGGFHQENYCFIMEKPPEKELFFRDGGVFYKVSNEKECHRLFRKDVKNQKLDVEYDDRTGGCRIVGNPEGLRIILSHEHRVFYPARGTIELDEPGVDRFGYDYASFSVSGDKECQNRCEFDPMCKAFTFVPEESVPFKKENAWCWLKYKKSKKQHIEGAKSGTRIP
jgi:hypothetical protein